ncbi:MAG: hypothetical protein QW666_03475 [Candidatus Woesearchaeota archaeon]
MVEVTRKLAITYIKHKGFLDVSKLIQSIRGWFLDNRYDFHFPKHKYAGPAGAAEQELEMYGERKMTEYVQFKISLLIRLYDLKDVEVVKNGEKIMSSTGRAAVEITPMMTLDYAKRFGGSVFMQTLQDIYHRYVIRTTIDDIWEDNIYMQVTDLAKLIKKQFQQETASA